MIGLDQAPNEDAQRKLVEALGDGQYTIEYRETPGGVAVIVQTREVPSRVWSSQVANGIPRSSMDAVWQELTSRITASVKHEKRQADVREHGAKTVAERDAAESIARTQAAAAPVDELHPGATEGPAILRAGNAPETAAESRAASGADDGQADHRKRELVDRLQPPDDVRGELDKLFGADGYEITYAGDDDDPQAHITTKTPPSKHGGIGFPTGASREQVEGLWRQAIATWAPRAGEGGER